jgi:hypothetical protein
LIIWFYVELKLSPSRILLDLNDFAAFVISALGAYAMWHPRFLAVWTGPGLRHAQRVVCAAFAGAGF